MPLLRDGFQDAADGTNHLRPTLRLSDQLLSAGRSQSVVLRFTVVL